jgi:hypothetical protein
MKRIAGVLAAFALAGAVAGVTAGVAAAEPKPEHVVGDNCFGYEVAKKEIDPYNRVIICDSNYHWEPYTGQVPEDPWVAGQH